MMFKQYLQVTKPGIIFGNLISVIGGFLLASKGRIDYPLFIYTLVGVSLVVASGCVFNNYIDRDIDRKMERTKNRVVVKGLISPAVSLVYATLLGIAGFMLLWFGARLSGCRRAQLHHHHRHSVRHPVVQNGQARALAVRRTDLQSVTIVSAVGPVQRIIIVRCTGLFYIQQAFHTP